MISPTGTTFTKRDCLQVSGFVYMQKVYFFFWNSILQNNEITFKTEGVHIELICQLCIAINLFNFNLIYRGKWAFLNVVYDGFLESGEVSVKNSFIAGIIA